MKHSLRRPIACLLIAVTVAACSGIPLRSLPRLMALQDTLLDLNPAEFMLAIQTDARMTPPPGAAPAMHVSIRPRVEGAFVPVEKTLPMRFSTSITSAASTNIVKGLALAPARRHWLIYSFTPESQAELARIQTYFKSLQARQQGKGGTVAVGIAQEGIATRDSELANTRWESWLQTSTREGFYELWSGTVASLLNASQRKAN